MTFDEAAGHVGNPVIIVEPGTKRPTDAEITGVDPERRLVGVRVRSRQAAHQWRPGTQWWAPCHLLIPAWWAGRSGKRSGVTA